jgi:archaellum component FlaG (FlaF/FlaG flagellin family)
MALPVTTQITVAELTALKASVSSGDQAQLHLVYDYLSMRGYRYANWAHGVVQGNSISGQYAVDYLSSSALMGIDGHQCLSISSEQMNHLKTAMANAYLDKLIQRAAANGGAVNDDINLEELIDSHNQGYGQAGLPIEGWTLNQPLAWMVEDFGPFWTDKLWIGLRNTGGTGSDAFAANTIIVSYMVYKAAFSDNLENRSLAQEWLNNSLGDGVSEGFVERGLGNTWAALKAELDHLFDPINQNTAADIQDWLERSGQGFSDYTSMFGNIAAAVSGIGVTTIINSTFLAARTVAPLRTDPLILDLDGDGLETVGINSGNPILFDHDGDGVKAATGWANSDDAFLVLDRNGNGSIDSGRELFGDSTPLAAGGTAADGFAALAEEDTNGDGKVDSLDARFVNLRLWRDLNQDGISQADELFTLASQSITSLNVAKTANSQVLANGNEIADLGSFVRADGTTSTFGAIEQLADVNLASNPFYSEFTDQILLTEQAQTLADMQGAGMVRSLREAASLQTTEGNALAAELAAFAAETTRSGQQNRLDALLKAWADTSTMATTASGAFAGVNLTLSFGGDTTVTPAWQARLDKISVLERFNGQTFLPVPAAGTTLTIDFYNTREALLNASYEALKASVYDGLVLQTRLKAYLEDITLNFDQIGVHSDFSALEDRLVAEYQTNEPNAIGDRLELIKYAGHDLHALGWGGEQILADWISEAVENGSWTSIRSAMGSLGDHAFPGTSGDDLVRGKEGADYLMGLGGDDTLTGLSGDDTLDGGAGNDTLYGGYGLGDPANPGNGNDTYLFDRGSGIDTISDYDATVGNVDTIRLAPGIVAADVTLGRDPGNSTNLWLTLNGTADKLIVQNWFSDVGFRVERIQFADGTEWDESVIAQAAVMGTAGSDTLTGLAAGDYLMGLGGDDTLTGLSGDDTLDGGAGNDTLYGGYGLGDPANPGNGNDTYLFDRGSGIDTISDYDATVGNVDTIRLAPGIVAADVTLGRDPGNSTNLWLTLNGTADKLIVQNWFSDVGFRVERIQFADGTEWDESVIAQAAVMGTAGSDTLTGLAAGDYLMGLGGDDTLYWPYGGDDTLDGGAGNDTLYGGYGLRRPRLCRHWNGNDTYLFDRGSGIDTISDYDATAGNIDTIRLAPGIVAADVTLGRDPGNSAHLWLTLNGTADRLIVQNWFYDVGYRVERIQFADGTEWDESVISQAALMGYRRAGHLDRSCHGRCAHGAGR